MSLKHDRLRADLAATQEDLNMVSVEFLLTDASAGLTFISTAEVTANHETRERNILNARKAYDFIQSSRGRYVLTDSQTESLGSRLRALKSRLEALGQAF